MDQRDALPERRVEHELARLDGYLFLDAVLEPERDPVQRLGRFDGSAVPHSPGLALPRVQRAPRAAGGSWTPRLKRAATFRHTIVASSNAHSVSAFQPSCFS